MKIPYPSLNGQNADSGQNYTSLFKNRSFTSFTPNKLVNDLFLKNEVQICPESAFWPFIAWMESTTFQKYNILTFTSKNRIFKK